MNECQGIDYVEIDFDDFDDFRSHPTFDILFGMPRVSEAGVVSAFATANIDLASVDGGVGKVLSLCALHGMNGDEILNAWDAFQCNHPEVDSLSLQALDVMAAELQTRADRTMFKPAAQAQPVEFDISNISSMYVYLAVWWRRSRGEGGVRGQKKKEVVESTLPFALLHPSSSTPPSLSLSLSLCVLL